MTDGKTCHGSTTEGRPAVGEAAPSVTIVLPVHDEEQVIENTVSAMGAIVAGRRGELIVVDDGSTDGGPAILDRLQASGQIRLLAHDRNRGYGAALRSGIAASRGGVIALVDADGQIEAADVVTALAAVDRGARHVIGIRGTRADHGSRRLLGKAGRATARRLFLPSWVRDVNCGLKVFPGPELRRLDLISDSAFISTEIVAKLSPRADEVAQFEIHHRPRLSGQSSAGRIGPMMMVVYDGLRFFVTRGRRRLRSAAQ